MESREQHVHSQSRHITRPEKQGRAACSLVGVLVKLILNHQSRVVLSICGRFGSNGLSREMPEKVLREQNSPKATDVSVSSVSLIAGSNDWLNAGNSGVGLDKRVSYSSFGVELGCFERLRVISLDKECEVGRLWVSSSLSFKAEQPLHGKMTEQRPSDRAEKRTQDNLPVCSDSPMGYTKLEWGECKGEWDGEMVRATESPWCCTFDETGYWHTSSLKIARA